MRMKTRTLHFNHFQLIVFSNKLHIKRTRNVQSLNNLYALSRARKVTVLNTSVQEGTPKLHHQNAPQHFQYVR